jgi:hypothetical protein
MNQQEGQSLHQKYGDAVDETMVLRLKALIRQSWPEEFNVRRADLKVVRPDGKLVWPKKQRRRNLAKVKAARTKVATKSREPKPAQEFNATILAFPSVYLGDQLDERFEFIDKHAAEWSTWDPDATQVVDPDWRCIDATFEKVMGYPRVTNHEKRKRVAQGRARIESRNRVKAYLERRGVDLNKISNAEEALFALFNLVEAAP